MASFDHQLHPAGRVSYAQFAEDLFAVNFLGERGRPVTYLDVGCLWPVYASNTYYFYERGGYGVCIDANPDAAAPFERERPRDIFVNSGVGRSAGSLPYHRYDVAVFNTFSSERVQELASKGDPSGPRYVETIEIPVAPLMTILEEIEWRERFPDGFDFFSLDIEGWELEVVDTIDWNELRPELICCETLIVGNNPIVERLEQVGYRLAGFTSHDVFMKRIQP